MCRSAVSSRAFFCLLAQSVLVAALRAKDWRKVAADACTLTSRRPCAVRLALIIRKPVCILIAAMISSVLPSSCCALSGSEALGGVTRPEMSMAWKPGAGFGCSFLNRNAIARE